MELNQLGVSRCPIESGAIGMFRIALVTQRLRRFPMSHLIDFLQQPSVSLLLSQNEVLGRSSDAVQARDGEGRASEPARNPPRPEAGRPSQREGEIKLHDLCVREGEFNLACVAF